MRTGARPAGPGSARADQSVGGGAEVGVVAPAQPGELARHAPPEHRREGAVAALHADEPGLLDGAVDDVDRRVRIEPTGELDPVAELLGPEVGAVRGPGSPPTVSASSARTAVAGVSRACVQCSVRAAPVGRATSPAATTPRVRVRPHPSTRTLPSQSTPDPASHSVLGIAPMPASTRSTGSGAASSREIPVTRSAPTGTTDPTPVRRSTP